MPWYAKALAVFIAGYALSPIDLIPDFIPVIGYLDEVILLPLGIWAVIRLIPLDVMQEHRQLATTRERPTSKIAAIVIVLIWAVSVAMCGWLGYRYFIS